MDQWYTILYVAVLTAVTYIWPQWLLFAQHSSSQSSDGVSVLLDWLSGYSYLIFCFQGVDFPAIPTEAIFLIS